MITTIFTKKNFTNDSRDEVGCLICSSTKEKILHDNGYQKIKQKYTTKQSTIIVICNNVMTLSDTVVSSLLFENKNNI